MTNGFCAGKQYRWSKSLEEITTVDAQKQQVLKGLVKDCFRNKTLTYHLDIRPISLDFESL